MRATPEIDPPFDEHCQHRAIPVSGTSAPEWLVDTSAEGRLVGWLRSAAQCMDPIEILKQSAVSFYRVYKGIPTDTLDGAMALADLAVSGRRTYSRFSAHPPQEADLLNDVRGRLAGVVQTQADEENVLGMVKATLDRAYRVAWVLRDPNPATRHQTRQSLSPFWIAVSGEDDPPDRPVNVSSAAFPQFDIPVTCQGHTVHTRYMIALPGPPPYSWVHPTAPFRPIPGILSPVIPADHEVILFIHGHSSRIEESSDLVGPLHQAGLQMGKKYAVVAFDLPSNGYSEMIEHTSIAASNATQFSTSPFTSSPATYPLLDFLVEFVISFVKALDEHVSITNRIAAVIGGSLGGNLCLRLGERNEPWIKNIAAWSPASAWSTFNHDLLKGVALTTVQGRMNEGESASSRSKFFQEAFDSTAGPGTPPQPQMWYRDSWPCKASYIADDRIQRQEIYNPIFRRWHWRVALEQLLFSHLNTDTADGSPRCAANRTHTFLAAGKDDDYSWSNIYSATRTLADRMAMTPGTSLFLRNTGHSIHNERPLLLSQNIVRFVLGSALDIGYQHFLLQTGTKLDETDCSFDFVVAPNLDLFAIKKSGTGTHSTEVHVLSAASQYQQFALQTGTALGETDDSYTFGLGANRDLYTIRKGGVRTRKTEVHILSAASNYQQFVLETATALDETIDAWAFGLTYSRLGPQASELVYQAAASGLLQMLGIATGYMDLMAIKKSGTDTDKTEVHILRGC